MIKRKIKFITIKITIISLIRLIKLNLKSDNDVVIDYHRKADEADHKIILLKVTDYH
jgi:hypothetical protein